MSKKSLFLIILLLIASATAIWAQAIATNGTTQYVVINDTAKLNPTNVTVECSVKFNSFTTRPHLVGKGGASSGAYWLVVETNGELRFYHTVGNAGSWQYVSAGTGVGNVLTTNVWYHLAGTYDGTNARIYVNAVLKNTRAASPSGNLRTNNTDPLYLGRAYSASPSLYLNGYMDEVRIWNVVRTQAELSTYMTTEIAPVPASLVGYWKLNNNANDSAANPQHGTLMGSPSFVGGPVTLPIELSSFTALPTAEYFVKLHWVTQSETDVSGYYIYRNTANDISTAMQVSPFIPATNTSSETEYEYVDTEVSPNTTYYYWLQNIDMNGDINYHGPVTVYVNDNENGGSPDVPLLTSLQSIYPNPFHPITTIAYGVKTAEQVTIEIYNLKGVKVRTLVSEAKAPGTFRHQWNSLDDNGNACPSGVYFVKMTAGKYTTSQKIILMK